MGIAALTNRHPGLYTPPMLGIRTKGVALAAIMLCLSAVGCSSSRTLTFQVLVTNESSRPATVWLTKDGPEYEPLWMAPEDLAISTQRAGEMIGGVIVQPGKRMGVGPVSGKFYPGVHGVLRVYGGTRGFNEILALSRGNPDRQDILLQTGDSEFVIRDGKPEGIEVVPVFKGAAP